MLRVRRVPHTRVDPGAVVQDAASVGERLETKLTLVLAHPRVAHSSEGKLGEKWLDRAFVNARATRFGRVQDALGHAEVFSEHVCAKRRWLAFDRDRKSTRLNSSHLGISYAVF